MHIDKWKKSVWEGHILHDSNNTTFWKGQKDIYGKKSVVARDQEEVKDE